MERAGSKKAHVPGDMSGNNGYKDGKKSKKPQPGEEGYESPAYSPTPRTHTQQKRLLALAQQQGLVDVDEAYARDMAVALESSSSSSDEDAAHSAARAAEEGAREEVDRVYTPGFSGPEWYEKEEVTELLADDDDKKEKKTPVASKREHLQARQRELEEERDDDEDEEEPQKKRTCAAHAPQQEAAHAEAKKKKKPVLALAQQQQQQPTEEEEEEKGPVDAIRDMALALMRSLAQAAPTAEAIAKLKREIEMKKAMLEAMELVQQDEQQQQKKKKKQQLPRH